MFLKLSHSLGPGDRNQLGVVAPEESISAIVQIEDAQISDTVAVVGSQNS
jgi:hypothetical protein